MKVLDHEPQSWFLLEENGALYLDANCNHSFTGYDFLLELDAKETAKFRSEGRAYLSWLAQDIHYSAPIVAASNSQYKGRDRSAEYSERVTAAVNEWRQAGNANPTIQEPPLSDRFDRYAPRLIALVKESITCSPGTWNAGFLTIDCDGSYMNYSLKNSASEDKAQISGELRQLCEDLYVEMRQSGDWWVKAVLHFFQVDGTWSYKVDFTYQDKATPRQNPAKPWWKFWN